MAGRDTSATAAVTFVGGFGTRFFETVSQDGFRMCDGPAIGKHLFELAILGVLWERGASTVRQVQQGLPRRREMGYTTALKLLQIMYEKGLVERDESHRAHVYRAVAARESTQRHLVRDLLQKGFQGSSEDLVLRVLESKPCSGAELQTIRELIERFERGENL